MRSGKKTALIVAAIILLAALIGTAITFLVKGYGSQVSAALINARESDTSESNTVENSASGGNTSLGNTSESDTDGNWCGYEFQNFSGSENPALASALKTLSFT